MNELSLEEFIKLDALGLIELESKMMRKSIFVANITHLLWQLFRRVKKMVKKRRKKNMGSLKKGRNVLKNSFKDKRVRYGILLTGMFIILLMGIGGFNFSAYDSSTISMETHSGDSIGMSGIVKADGLYLYVMDFEGVPVVPSLYTTSDVLISAGVYDDDWDSGQAIDHRFDIPLIDVLDGVNSYYLATDDGWSSFIFDIEGLAVGGDGTLPVVEITSPMDGVVVEGIVSIEFTATDDLSTITSTKILIDGDEVGTTLVYAYSWDTVGFIDGTYVIYCEAIDSSGNIGYDVVSVIIGEDDGSGGTLPGEPIFASKPSNMTFDNVTPEGLEVIWSVKDDNLKFYIVKYNGTTYGTQSLTGYTEIDIPVSIKELGPGTHIFNMTVADLDGNVITHMLEIQVTGERPLDIMAYLTANPIIVIVVLFLFLGGGGGVAASRR